MADHKPQAAGEVVVSSLAEGDWRMLRDVRLAALADAPESFATSAADESGRPETYWRALAGGGGIFAALSDGAPVGMAAGTAREPAGERGLAAMWVAPSWRGRGAAAMLAAAVAGWARAQGAHRLSLWVPADNPRARRFYGRQGFARTGRSLPFPGHRDRSVLEMVVRLSDPGPEEG